MQKILLSLITITAILQLAIATSVSPPTLYSRHGSQHGSLSPSLKKRADCGDGTRCLLGSCCGDGCAMNCCALDNGGCMPFLPWPFFILCFTDE